MPMKDNITTRQSSPPGALGALGFEGHSISFSAKTSAWVDGVGWPLSIIKPDRHDALRSENPFPRIIGQDAKMKAIFRQILDAAPYDYPVHLSGATGTGKELAARAIHDHSRRRQGPFVPVNCGALPENIVESELFGHVKGAFTGAERSRQGRFELAHRGTLFLDEVADLSPYIQVRLLRVLQCGQFEKVGGERTIGVDVRLISATNKPLKAEMNAGRFRQDLFYRLNVVPIHMPPLKARRGDIALLARHFLHLAAMRYHRQPVVFTDAALFSLQSHDWPGNVRELQNAVHFALVRARGRVIDAIHLPSDVQQAAVAGKTCRLKADAVAAALDRCGGNKSRAARYLGVGRATLYRFLSASPESTWG
jgi:sigma-54 dependent transcriptional regulator, acetoin dehydrogenase operon transcriptional activator AcoR